MKLDSLPLLVDQLKLNEHSLFDYWSSSWETITPSSIIFIEKGCTVILRHRPSLIEDIPLSQCPGISTHLALQSHPRISKRMAENTLVSPLKKSGRTSSSIDISKAIPFSSETKSQMLTEGTGCIERSERSSAVIVLDQPDTPLQSSQLDDDDGLPVLNEGKGQLINRSVFSWDLGWKKINEMIDNNSNITEAATFPIVFWLKYVKSTVSSYKQTWEKAPEHIKSQFIAYGDTGKGSWKNFNIAVNDYFKKRKEQSRAPQVPRNPSNNISSSIPSLHPGPHPPIKKEPTAILIEDFEEQQPSLNPPPAVIPELSPPLKLPPALVQKLSPPVKSPPALMPKPFPMTLSELSPISSPLLPARHVEKILDDKILEEFQPAVNPLSLCPFCDQQLPNNPSQLLLDMRAELEEKTWESLTLFNPLHREAARFQDFIIYCTRHMFESDLLPTAMTNGWPLHPNFGSIFDRVCWQYLSLASIAKGSQNEFMTSAVEFYSQPTRQQGLLGELASNRFLESGAG